MRVVVEIAGAGMVLLFAALGALVSLMYLLTNPTLFGEPGRQARRARRRARKVRRLQKRGRLPAAEETTQDARQERLDEHDRRRRAAALAVAAACAREDSVLLLSQDDAAEWRLFHRNLRLRQRATRGI